MFSVTRIPSESLGSHQEKYLLPGFPFITLHIPRPWPATAASMVELQDGRLLIGATGYTCWT
jgi:hypothetical protein